MASTTYRQPRLHEAPSLRRRAAGFALAIVVNLLLLLVMRELGVLPSVALTPSRTLVVTLTPQSDETASKPAKAEVKPRKTVPVPRPPRLPQAPRLHSPIPPLRPLDMIEMTHDELAAADVRNLPRADAGGGSAGDSKEVGRGPNGEILYAAEWAREPTNAELAGYLPPNAPEGSGLIACKTMPGNRVDNCIELGDSPRGTHLARAVRLAAWQFRVRPPRKGGRAMVGEWVRIRIDYYHGGSD